MTGASPYPAVADASERGAPRVAIVHDYLTQRGGAERVVLSMLKAFPGAPLYTSLLDPHGTFPEFGRADVRTIATDRWPFLREHHRLALPVLAPAFSCTNVLGDVVLCSSSGWAHGVRVTGRKVVYCYTPARWLYQRGVYIGSFPSLARAALAPLHPLLVRWDRAKAASADRYLVVSTVVRERVRTVYGIDAEVLPPPVSIDARGTRQDATGLEPGFFLCVSRLLSYKNVAAVVEAFAALPNERLVVAGDGPEGQRIAAAAGPNVSLVGTVDDDQLRWLYDSCSGLVAAGQEDYGLTPLESAAFGRPSAVLRYGGFLDTVVDEETGLFFDVPSPDQIARAVERLRARKWDPSVLQAQAARFGEGAFVARLRAVVAEEAAA